MWTKITTPEQLANLAVNDCIVKYPIFGEPAEEFNPASIDDCSVRIITRNNTLFQNLDMGFPDSVINYHVILGIDTIVIGTIRKDYNEIIDENLYWVNMN